MIPDALHGNGRRLLKQAARKQWVVYSKPPFAGAEQGLAYLGRYAYRIALSNERLVALDTGQVTFRWKDRAHGNAPRLATLDATTFLRRFLLPPLRPDPPLRFPCQCRAPAATTPRAPAPRPRGGRDRIHRATRAGTGGSAAPPADRQGCHSVSALRCRTPARHRRTAWADEAQRFLTPSKEPMNPDAPRLALSASAQTPPLCLRQLSSSRPAVPSRFIAAPLGPRPARCRELSPPSPPIPALLPLTFLD
jgi:hypothetical protein